MTFDRLKLILNDKVRNKIASEGNSKIIKLEFQSQNNYVVAFIYIVFIFRTFLFLDDVNYCIFWEHECVLVFLRRYPGSKKGQKMYIKCMYS